MSESAVKSSTSFTSLQTLKPSNHLLCQIFRQERRRMAHYPFDELVLIGRKFALRNSKNLHEWQAELVHLLDREGYIRHDLDSPQFLQSYRVALLYFAIAPKYATDLITKPEDLCRANSLYENFTPISKQDFQRVYQALSVLPEREREIIRLRYGFEDGKPWLSLSIAKQFGISAARVDQLIERALVTNGQTRLYQHLPQIFTSEAYNADINRLINPKQLEGTSESKLKSELYYLSQLPFKCAAAEPYRKCHLSILGLSARTSKALLRAGIMSVPELVALSESELFRIRQIGPNHLDEIKHQLAELGLSLATKPE